MAAAPLTLCVAVCCCVLLCGTVQAFGEKGDTEVQHMYWTRAIELHERHFGAPPEDPEMDVGEDVEGSVLP